MNAVTKLLDVIRSEPIRTILYPLLVILVGTLLAKGGISEFSADTIIAVVAAVLGIPATEIARRNVTPVSRPPVGERE